MTLHGEGGIGKTRLAGAVAEWLAERGEFPGGIIEVDCERASTGVELATTILTALGVDRPEGIPDPAATLAELLGEGTESCLLVLDNLETAFAHPDANQDDAATSLAVVVPGMLLKQCLTQAPKLRVLATSRWPLNLGSDENAFELDPLSEDEAVELFIMSVHHQDLRDQLLAAPARQRAVALAGILRATERMPLALVLAARRLTDPGQDLATLIKGASDDLLSVCEDERLRHLPPRLRSVRASLELSFERLSEPARELFARMSFFPSGLSRSFEPLEQLLGDQWQQRLKELADFALARYDREQDRYTLLYPIFAFAEEKLDASEADAFRHQAVQLWMGAVTAYDRLLAPSQLSTESLAALHLTDDAETRGIALEALRKQVFGLLSTEVENIVHATAWSLGTEDKAGSSLLGAVDRLLDLRALWHTQEQLFGLAERWADRIADEPAALVWRGNRAGVFSKLRRWDDAKVLYREILEAFRRLAELDPDAHLRNVATTLNNLGALLANLGEREAARSHYDEALGLRRQLAARYPDAYLPDVAMTLNNLGALLANLGEREAARSHDEALDLYRQLAARYPDAYVPNVAMTLNNLGNLLADLGEREAARSHYEEALEIYWNFFATHPSAFRRNVLIVLNGLRRVYEKLGLEKEQRRCEALIKQLPGEEGAV